MNRNSRGANGFRQEHVARQKPSVHVVPHAVCWLERTDSVSEPDDDRLSRNGSLSGRQADAAATHVFTVLPCAAIQQGTATILWWEFLGFTRDWIQATKSRRRTGTGPSR